MNLNKIGVMQGRLLPQIGKKIQAFPKKNWEKEFLYANSIGIKYLEWTLDYEDIFKNPIFTKKGIFKIRFLSKKYSIKIRSLTGDCFMQKPFWKRKKSDSLVKDLIKIIDACSNLNIKKIVIPLVDKGSIKKKWHEKKLINVFKSLKKYIEKKKILILFESDYKPIKLRNFIKNFNLKSFGINYDTGNSASLGFDVKKEILTYGKYIKGVHIKDRFYKGKTVRLGKGDANLLVFFRLLKSIHYNDFLILQTARSEYKKDIEEIKTNLSYINNLIK